MWRRPSASPVRFAGPVLALVLTGGALSADGAASAQPARKIPPAEAAAIERRLIATAEHEPPKAEAYHALAAFYLQQGRVEAAIPHLQRAQQIDPGHYASGYDLALALLQSGGIDAARAQVRKMLAAKETGELVNLLGDIEEQAGNLVGAAQAYERAAHLAATEEHLFDWGNNLIQLRAFEPATEVFTAAIARHPTSARLHVGLGIAQYSRGEYDQAAKTFCAAADLAPSDPRPYQFLGEMYGVAPDQSAEITKRLARFVKLQPHNAMAHLYYALSLWKGQSGSLDPADARRVEASLRRAVALDKQLTKGFLELGILLSDLGRHEEAIPELRRATELEPDLPQAHYRLAQAYQRTGQPDLAAKELEIFGRLSKKK